jgi:hypothetical protein
MHVSADGVLMCHFFFVARRLHTWADFTRVLGINAFGSAEWVLEFMV